MPVLERLSLQLLGLACVFALTLANAAGDSLKVIELKHRPAAELASVVRSLLGPNDALSTTDYRLIVRASPVTLAEVERVVRQLDVARRQLTITVRHVQSGERERTTHGISGEVPIGRSGSVRLPPQTHGNETVIIGKRDGVQYRGGERRTTSELEQTQQLRVQDGASAYIRMGQSIPQVQQVLMLAGDRAVLSQGVTLRDVTTGFDVRPQVRGEQVQLDITPRVARLSDPRHAIVDFRELATTVTARLGEWIDLGQILGTNSEVNRAILQRDTARSDEQWRVLLKVE